VVMKQLRHDGITDFINRHSLKKDTPLILGVSLFFSIKLDE